MSWIDIKYFIHTKDPIAHSSLFERTLLPHEVSCLHLLSFLYVIGLHKRDKLLIIGSYMNLLTKNGFCLKIQFDALIILKVVVYATIEKKLVTIHLILLHLRDLLNLYICVLNSYENHTL